MLQFQSNGTTAITTGNGATSTSVVLKATVNDPDAADTDALCLEVRAINVAFSNVDTQCGSLVAQGTATPLTFTATTGAQYHWQARTKDAQGEYGPWAVFGGNADLPLPAAVDFFANSLPTAPSSLAQLKSDGSTSLGTGNWNPSSTVVIKGTPNDPDAFDSVYLCVEIKDVATPFANTDTTCSGSPVSPGAQTSITVSTGLLNSTQYHWQARSKDATGQYSSSWTAFGGNLDTPTIDPDFGIDTSNPTDGTVNDGLASDVSSNDGSLTTLKANWTGFGDNVGITQYKYSIGTTPGGTTIKGWTSNSTSTSVTDSSLSLVTSTTYYVNVQAFDASGRGSSIVSSNGQTVLPILTFSVGAVASGAACGDVTTNSTSTSGAITLQQLGGTSAHIISGQTLNITTNASGGYIVLASSATGVIGGSTGHTYTPVGGTNASPITWPANGTEAFGYTTEASNLNGTAGRFHTSKWAALSSTGGEVMHNGGPAVAGDSKCVAFQASSSTLTPADNYSGSVTYTVVPSF